MPQFRHKLPIPGQVASVLHFKWARGGNAMITSQVDNMIRRNDGFSLPEMMTVIGIIALVCGIALPAAVSWLPKIKQGSAARGVMAVFEKARMLAIKRNSYALVDLQGNTISVYLCTDEKRNCTDPGDARSVDLTKLKTIYQYQTPSGVSLKEPNNVFASLNLTSDKKFTNISDRPHFRFSKEGYPVDAATRQGDLMRGSIGVSPGSKFEDKLIFVSAGGNVKIKRPDDSDGELKK
jgi:prepilin-type N-terminal cleavage/methylation domain-containing protein